MWKTPRGKGIWEMIFKSMLAFLHLNVYRRSFSPWKVALNPMNLHKPKNCFVFVKCQRICGFSNRYHNFRWSIFPHSWGRNLRFWWGKNHPAMFPKVSSVPVRLRMVQSWRRRLLPSVDDGNQGLRPFDWDKIHLAFYGGLNWHLIDAKKGTWLA